MGTPRPYSQLRCSSPPMHWSPSGPPDRTSCCLPPRSRSSPSFPRRRSSPRPPWIRSRLWPPLIQSRPNPVQIRSSPPRPRTKSAPPPAMITSSSGVLIKRSSALVPTMVAGRPKHSSGLPGTPLAGGFRLMSPNMSVATRETAPRTPAGSRSFRYTSRL